LGGAEQGQLHSPAPLDEVVGWGDAVCSDQCRRAAVSEFFKDVITAGRAQPIEIRDLRPTEHLDSVRMNEVEVAGLIDRIRGSHGRLLSGEVLAGDPSKPEIRSGLGDQFVEAQSRACPIVGQRELTLAVHQAAGR
jgi:hypothetical protein